MYAQPWPEPLAELIEMLKNLPGVGKRSAERMALSLYLWEPAKLEALAGNLASIHERIHACPECGNLSDAPGNGPCAICASPGYILPVLAVKGVKVSGLHFTCYPGCEEDAVAAGALHDALPCITDGHLITANGPGSALAFGYAICAKIISTSSTEVLMKGMMYR